MFRVAGVAKSIRTRLITIIADRLCTGAGGGHAAELWPREDNIIKNISPPVDVLAQHENGRHAAISYDPAKTALKTLWDTFTRIIK